MTFDPEASSHEQLAVRQRLVDDLVAAQDAIRQFDLDEAEHHLPEAERSCRCDPSTRTWDDDCQVSYWLGRIATITAGRYP